MGVRISCVIPTFNRNEVLCATIQMLLRQTVPAHEILVVDQSIRHEPETEHALKAWAKQGAIRWLGQKEPNASLARNAGALAATGDVLLFLDDDILVEEGFLAAHAKNYENPSTVAVAGQVLEGSRETVDDLPARAMNAETGWLYFPRNYTGRCETGWMMAGNFSIRKQVFIEVGGMDAWYKRGAFREESDFAMRFAQKSYRFQYDPKASLYHLGMHGAPMGGCRNWIRNKNIHGFHHCIGDWYFFFGHVSLKNVFKLLSASIRGFLLNAYNRRRPWLIPILGVRWLFALPIALVRRMTGAKTIDREITIPTSLRESA